MSSAAHPTPSMLQPRTSSASIARSSASVVPWYIWTGAVAVSCASVGGAWDVSWHRSIGRDSFWTPAHLMIQACGVLAAVIGLWLVSTATFGRSEKSRRLRAASVDIFGLYAPLGVFVAAWGGIAMLTSAPFDNWWHNAYGLDVKIISPPHTLLILGIRSVSVGVMLLILAAMNRAAEAANPTAAGFTTLQRIFLYLGGLAVGGQMFFLQEETWDVVLHRSMAYIAMAIALPILFAVLYEASRFRWAATTTASIYMAVIIAEILIFPLFPATPKLGPVFYQVTHLVPAKFPVLLIVPALALDLFWQRAKSWKPWQVAIVSGILFVVVLFAVEWPFANFLLSPFAENRFFGSIYFDYSSGPTGYERTHRFFQPEYGMVLAKGLLIARCMRDGIDLDRASLRSLDAWSATVKPVSIQRHLRTFLLFLSIVAMALPAHAHVGNKDVFETINVGPYKFFVTIRTPLVIPGVATIEVRSIGAPVTSLTITPLLLTGEASRHPPTPDAMKVSATDPTFYTGSLWLMATGSWQVRFSVDGAGGPMAASVPVPAASTSLLKMQRPLGILLGLLSVLLVVGVVGIVIAAVGQARLTPGVQPDAARRRRGLLAGCAALVFALLAVYGGGYWWNVEAAGYSADLYRASDLHATLNNGILDLRMGNLISGSDGKGATWKPLKLGRMLTDHGHYMHLYAIREPEMDAVFHLHPSPLGQEAMQIALPAMPAGTYKLFADIVYGNGFPETETATITIPPGQPGIALATEDASAAPPALSFGDLGTSYKLPDGYTMVFDRPANITAGTGYTFRFQLLDATGKPATDMQPYLGMAGHAAFVKADFSAFAHTHPDGSAAMPALMLAESSTAAAAGKTSLMEMPAEPLTSTVEFPYGFPSPGRYRVFIQMKHGDTVETGVFDAEVH